MAGLMIVFSSLALQASGGGDIPPKPPASLPTPQQVKNAIVGCGLPTSGVSVQFERSMDEDVVWIASDSQHLSDKALDCVATASLSTSYYVYFRDPQEQKAYDPHYWRLSHDNEVASAQQWLRARNLFSSVPHPMTGEPLANYAGAVEAFCGVKKHSLLAVRDEHTMTFSEAGLGKVTANGVEGSAATSDQFECVMNATSAVDLNAKGIFFGLMGNETKKP